jgi:hypothetical protein
MITDLRRHRKITQKTAFHAIVKRDLKESVPINSEKRNSFCLTKCAIIIENADEY